MARKKGPDRVEVPMSAMIDVVFLLLIFFTLTKKPQIPEAHVAINLPAPNPPPSTQVDQPPLLEIKILASGELLLRDKSMAPTALREWLLDIAAFNTEQTVIIKVAPTATEGQLMDVLDMCSQANLTQLNVMMLN